MALDMIGHDGHDNIHMHTHPVRSLYVRFGCMLLNRKEDFASPGYTVSSAVIASKATQDNEACAATAAAKGTDARQRMHT